MISIESCSLFENVQLDIIIVFETSISFAIASTTLNSSMAISPGHVSPLALTPKIPVILKCTIVEVGLIRITSSTQASTCSPILLKIVV